MKFASVFPRPLNRVLCKLREGDANKMPVVVLHAVNGSVYGTTLLKHLPAAEGAAVYFLQAPEAVGDRHLFESFQERLAFYYRALTEHIRPLTGAHLLGYSAGCFLAQQLAFLFRDDALSVSLTLVDPMPFRPVPLARFSHVRWLEIALRFSAMARLGATPEALRHLALVAGRLRERLEKGECDSVGELRDALDDGQENGAVIAERIFDLIDTTVRLFDFEPVRAGAPDLGPDAPPTRVILMDATFQKDWWDLIFAQLEPKGEGGPRRELHESEYSRDHLYGFRARLPSKTEVVEAEGHHAEFFQIEANVAELARHLQANVHHFEQLKRLAGE